MLKYLRQMENISQLHTPLCQFDLTLNSSIFHTAMAPAASPRAA